MQVYTYKALNGAINAKAALGNWQTAKNVDYDETNELDTKNYFENLTNFEDIAVEYAYDAYQNFIVLLSLNYITLLYIFSIIMQKYHALSRRKQIRLFDFEIIINLTGFITFVVWNVMHFSYWTDINKDQLDDPDFQKV